MAQDNWGHQIDEVDGVPAIKHWYSDNDGPAFLRNGPERELIVDVLDATRAEVAIRQSKMKPEVEAALLKQLAEGKSRLFYHLDRDHAWPQMRRDP